MEYDKSIAPNQAVHEGQMYLDALDMGYLGEEPITFQDGTTIAAKDFLDHGKCREKALPALVGFMTLEQSNPRRDASRKLLRSFVYKHLGRTDPEDFQSSDSEA